MSDDDYLLEHHLYYTMMKSEDKNMLDDEFPSNSRARRRDDLPEEESKSEKPKVERVVRGEVIRRKKPLGKRFMETFMGLDAHDVWKFVVTDVLIPAAKDMVVDAGQEALQRTFYGESRRGGYSPYRNGSGRSGGGYVSYNRYSSSSNRDSRDRDRDSRDRDRGPRDERSASRRSRALQNFEEIILPTRVEADEVLDRMYDLIEKFDVATLADLYEMVGIKTEFTDANWGWSELRGARVEHLRNGYLLDIPKPEFIDD